LGQVWDELAASPWFVRQQLSPERGDRVQIHPLELTAESTPQSALGDWLKERKKGLGVLGGNQVNSLAHRPAPHCPAVEEQLIEFIGIEAGEPRP
jgi:hypothetical protein